MAASPKLLKPTSKPVLDYYAALAAFAHQRASNEQAVRSAFQSLLADAAKPFKWTLIPELGTKVRGKQIVPDATFRDHYHLPRGYWEAKDSADDLNAEINAKIKKGYPTSNIIFWTPDRAVLIQNKRRELDLDIGDHDSGRQALCDLLARFYSYTEQPFVDFEDAIREFSDRVPELGARLAEIIAEAHTTNVKFKAAFALFFDLCKTALNPNISQVAVDEMLVQHLLTERLFKTVFSNAEFLRHNVIAVEVDKVIAALASRSFSRDDFLKTLDRFYLAIENAAAHIREFTDKQHFLNTVYQRFFQGYCVKTADTHGIVYTPQPIVDFMCASVEHVLNTEFGKSLGDDGVVVLDPCAGTGNFVVNLMRRAAVRGKRHLQRMYREQLFANEIMLLPYYIAALNIEHEFFAHSGDYESFEGLCFVDTLELAEAKSQIGLFGEKNLERVSRQKSAPITVVIGNPPYNVGQMVHNEQNKNRPYPVVDYRVKVTYGKASRATSVSKLNDPYVKFFRWATDRLNGRDGIVCFVSNNSFVEQIAFDGMRKHLAQDFHAIYHVDLEGNVRHNPTLSGTQYNVFGIRVGVGITIAVRHEGLRRAVRYANVRKDMRRIDKLDWLMKHPTVDDVKWKTLRPDERHTWLALPNGDEFTEFVPIADKSARAKEHAAPKVIFLDYSLGVATHRDAIVYDFSRDALVKRIKAFIEEYNTEVDRWKRAPKNAKIDEYVRYDKIAWDRDLKKDVQRGRHVKFGAKAARVATYRPFARTWLYFDRILDAEVYGFPAIAPAAEQDAENSCIVMSDIAWRSQVFGVMVVSGLADLHLCSTLDGHQCLPFYIYDEDGSNRRENITDWALDAFRGHYKSRGPWAAKITKWDIFHYVYAILHHPGYRENFAENLKRELPRIPFAMVFRAFAKAGERLAELHLKYDDENAVKPYSLKEAWTSGKRRDYRVEKMKLSNDKATLVYNESLTLTGIPPEVFDYQLGNRSALEWVIDQYQVHTDKRSGITSDPNAWGEERGDEEYIVRLVKQVVTVSLETMKVVKGLPTEFTGPVKA